MAFNQAEQVLRRICALREQNAKLARELEVAEFDQRKAEADLTAAEALRKTYERAKKRLADRPRSVDLSNGMPAVELKAPIAGVIIGVSATVGEHVHSDGAVYTILNPEGVLIEAQIPEADLSRLESSRGATYETSDAPGTFAPILGKGGGRLVYLGTTVDPKTRTVIPGTNITIGQPISHRIDHMLSGTWANIVVKIFGEDLYTLRALGEKVRQAVATVPGAVDVSVEQQIDVPILGVRVPIPLFNRYQGRIHEARADFVADEARARSVRNELTLELQTSYRTLARAIAAAQLLREEILPRAESVLRSAETRYANGDISLAELLPIRRDWTRARLDYLEALNEVTQAWAALSPYV